MATAQQIIDAIDAAILDRLSGDNTLKSARKDSEGYENYSLDELRRLRSDYQAQLSSSSSGSTRNYVSF